MVLVYMLTWLGYIDGIHVTIYIYNYIYIEHTWIIYGQCHSSAQSPWFFTSPWFRFLPASHLLHLSHWAAQPEIASWDFRRSASGDGERWKPRGLAINKTRKMRDNWIWAENFFFEALDVMGIPVPCGKLISTSEKGRDSTDNLIPQRNWIEAGNSKVSFPIGMGKEVNR